MHPFDRLTSAVKRAVSRVVGPSSVIHVDELDPAPDETFTIVAIPDTQAYTAREPSIFQAIVDWIVEHVESQRIVFVTHVGDRTRRCSRRRFRPNASLATLGTADKCAATRTVISASNVGASIC
jgi:hypothetical protein